MVSILSDTQFSEYHFESKCRVCLTDLLGDITDLNSPLNNETDDLLIYEALETVMGEDVPMGQDYPNGICGMCLSLLSIAYDLKLQYFKSKNKLLTLCTEGQNVENSNNLSFAIKYDQDNDLSNGSTEFKINIAVQHQEDYVESPESPENIQEISDDDTEEATNEQHVFQTKVEVENQEDSSIIDFVPHTYNMEPLEEVSVDLSCCYCKRTFSTAHYLKKHKIVCEKFNNLECYVCKMKFEEKKALISHIKSLHLINEKKSVKKKNSNSINAVVRVVEKIPEDLLCKICNKLCSNKKTLAYHISTHKEKQFGCEECGKMFSTKNLVEKHMQTHKRETKVICPVCGKSFHYDSGLFYHMKIHNNERKYQCSFCTKTFYNMCGLKRHERTHTGEKPFKCQFCGRGFRSTGERKSHVYLHTGERPFRCSLCSVGFTKPYNLNIHLMTHEGEHKCSVCKKGFITPETLSYHLKIKHGIKADERGAIDNEDIDEEEGDEDRNMNVTEEEETIEVDDYYAHYYEEVPEEFCTTAMEELQELITDKNCQDGRVTNDSSQSKLLLDVLQNNDIPSLKSILTQFSVDNLELKSSQKNCKNIVNIACIDESVECEVLSIILSYLNNKYPNLHWSESQWYYWEPIHFVAYSIDCKKLETLLNNYNKTRINALTIFSENAFHVLLHYGKRIESYKVHLTNGWESRACNVTAKEKNDLVECTKLLIAAGVDINHANIWGETPIMLAIKNGYHKILKILLKQKNIELKYGDTGPHSQKSVQDFIKENELSYETLSTPLSVENPCKIVFGLLKSDNEEVFLRYNNGNIKQYANSCDGDSDINTSGTMLQLCFLKGYLEILKRPNTKETIDIKDLINSSYVKLFISKGYVKSIEHLLNNGADVKCKNKMFNFHNLIVVSVKFCYFPFLIILLEHASNQVWSDDIFDVLEKNADELFKYKHHEVVYVFFILLTKLQNLCKCNDVHSTLINYRKKAVLNHTMELCLKYSLKNDFTDVILDNLKLGASLACPTSSNINPLDILDMATLEKHLNECVRNSSYICFDSLILDDIDNYSETIVLSSLIHDESKLELLNHPVLIYLTHCKWLKTNKFFYVDIVVYALFLISLYFYMISLHIDNLRPEITWIFQIFLTVHIIKEITQLCLFTYRYFFDVINYFEAFVLVFSAINCYTKNEVCIVLSILFSTMTFLYMLGQIPRFTKYMIIVSSTKYFFEYALFYFIQFFSFALCFFVLLPPEEEASRTNALGEIFKNLFDCLIYFIGQFDGEVASPVHFPVFGRIIVALFAFCMTIILNNLLVGLIVTDMDTIQKTAKVLRQVKTIKYIIRTEIFLKNLKNLPCFRKIKFIHDTNIFNKGQCKYVNYKFSMYDKRVFDDDDKAKLSQILEQNDLKNSFSKGCLKNFYQHIISESFSHSKINKGSQYILTKLHQLEGVLNRRSMMLN